MVKPGLLLPEMRSFRGVLRRCVFALVGLAMGMSPLACATILKDSSTAQPVDDEGLESPANPVQELAYFQQPALSDSELLKRIDDLHRVVAARMPQPPTTDPALPKLPILPRPDEIPATPPVPKPKAEPESPKTIPESKAPPSPKLNQLPNPLDSVTPLPAPKAEPEAPKTAPKEQSAPTPKIAELPRPADVGPKLLHQQSKPDPEAKGGPVLVSEPIETLPQPEKMSEPAVKPDARGSLLLSSARNAVARGALTEAIARFEDYLKLYPKDRLARREYAGVLVQLSRLKQAMEIYRTMLADDPDNKDLLLPLADVYLLMKDFRKAASLLSSALERSPTNLEFAAKLARAHAFDGDYTRAFQVFDRYLARLQPDDSRAPKIYGALLIDLGKPEDAIDFLLPLQEKSPDDLEILAYLVRAYARKGDRNRTLETISMMGGKKNPATAARLELAENLLQSSELEYAALMFAQVTQFDPSNALAQVGSARTNIQQYQPKAAFRTLQGMNPQGAARRSFLLAWAEYHQLVGEFTPAKEIYRTFLAQDDADAEARLALARLYEFVRDDEKAKAEYAHIPSDTSENRTARLGIASTLLAQRRFAEGIDVCRQLLRENPSDGAARAMMIRILTKSGGANEAEGLAREFFRMETRNEAAIVQVRLAYGKLLLDTRRAGDAVREYQAVLARPIGRVAPAFYGLARAKAQAGRTELAKAILDAGVMMLGDPRASIQFGDLFAADYNDTAAAEWYTAALRADASNLAVLTRVADLQQRLASTSGDVTLAMAAAEAVLHQSPSNNRGQLAMARTFSVGRKNREAIEVYNRLIAGDSEAMVPRRERARVLFADHAYGAAHAAYTEAQHFAAQELLKPDFQRLEGLPPGLDSYQVPSFGTDTPIGQLLQANNLGGDSYPREGIVSNLDGQNFELEDRAKSLKDVHKYEAIGVYRQLISQEPTNAEALFDLGQIYSTLKHTNKAIETYSELLNVDPQHREAAEATERASLEQQPQLLTDFSYFAQRGRNGLAAIDRFRYDTAVRLPYGDEEEYVQFGFSRVRYEPQGGDGVNGNIISIRAQKKFEERILLFGQANYETFQPGAFHDRVTFETGVRYEPIDLIRVYGIGFLENVAENLGSLRQDIYRGGVRLGGDVRPTRRWDFGANYMVAYYSDVNTLNSFNLFNEVELTYLPTQLKLVNRMEFLNYSQPTQFDPNDPTNVQTAIHPYFSPSGYSYYETRLEWLHYLSRDYFAHANVCYYGLQYSIGWDSNFVNYHTFRAYGNYDIRPWASIGVDTSARLSSVYNYVSVMAYLTLRLPHFSN